MDYWKALRDLYDERRRLNQLIAKLEADANGVSSTAPTRRGRKGMPPEERTLVSERMRCYWAERRNGSSGKRGT